MIAVFKYERLPDFCYICGRLEHQEIDCDDAIRMTIAGDKVKREYGPWLRAENRELLTGKKDNSGSTMVPQGTVSRGRRVAWQGGARQGFSSSTGGNLHWRACEKHESTRDDACKGKAVMVNSGETSDNGYKSSGRTCVGPRMSGSREEEVGSFSNADVDNLANTIKKAELAQNYRG